MVLGGVQLTLLLAVGLVLVTSALNGSSLTEKTKMAAFSLTIAEQRYREVHGSYTQDLRELSVYGLVVDPAVEFRWQFFNDTATGYCVGAFTRGRIITVSESSVREGSLYYWTNTSCDWTNLDNSVDLADLDL